MKLTRYNKPTIVAAKTITKFPTQFKNKDAYGRLITDEHGIVDTTTRTALVKLKFHLGKITLEHPTGSTSTITHTVKVVDGIPKHKVTWQNNIPGIRPMKREFYSAENFGEFLVHKYGIVLTTKILKQMSALEQGE